MFLPTADYYVCILPCRVTDQIMSSFATATCQQKTSSEYYYICPTAKSKKTSQRSAWRRNNPAIEWPVRSISAMIFIVFRVILQDTCLTLKFFLQ